MDNIISNVVFHHANVEDEEARIAGAIGDFDGVVVNFIKKHAIDEATILDQALTKSLWDEFTDQEKVSITDAYKAIQRVVATS